MSFDNPIVAGLQLLIQAIQSPNYVPGSSGWTINKDGSAEFNNLDIRGQFLGTDFIINNAGMFFYSSTPAHGNLVISLAIASGTDGFGNNYVAGIATYYGDEHPALIAGIAASGSESIIVLADSGAPIPPQIGLNGDIALTGSPGLLGTAGGASADAILAINGSAGWAVSQLTALISGSVETWHTVSPMNGWSAWAGGGGTPGYKMMPDGTVMFRGALTGGTETDGTTVFQLSAPYLPFADSVMPLAATAQASLADAAPRLAVRAATGDVQIYGLTTGASFNIDGIRYSVT